ncbi:hypothetical protein Saci_0021 [Sulfolobus acidocaldarius DSM 639]|uniref:Uncharacterized protein n=1 Tax=Sulfolobus acidocaldarius (strain ATCC 33909 / DSM 639 / JCM 8929 / NBRC 15157 / NCIMB 11770) TaxID=330779 RepID=Q4JCM8_SULAC|nr:hypothetical protein Saci_0021 [Sulfolobus acidocaldarius DSM 639]
MIEFSNILCDVSLVRENFLISPPGSPPTSIKGIFGFTLEPALTTNFVAFTSFSEALLIIAGVGIPVGVTGTEFIEIHFSLIKNSASAAGVKCVNSGVAPATVIPGIRLTSVVAITRINAKLPLRLIFPLIS